MINSTWFVLECGAKIERFALYRRLTGTRIRTPYIYKLYILAPHNQTSAHFILAYLLLANEMHTLQDPILGRRVSLTRGHLHVSPVLLKMFWLYIFICFGREYVSTTKINKQ